MNWRRSLIGVGISLPIVGLLAYGMTVDPKRIDSPLPGKEAPEFALQIMDSAPPDTARLSDHADEVVVLNFWASWCLECRVEHSDLSLVSTLYKDRGVQFFGVLYSDTEPNGRRWIREMGGQAYPALIDDRSRTAIDYGLYGVPETFIIHRGKVVHKQIGPITSTKLMEIIEPLVSANEATALESDS